MNIVVYGTDKFQDYNTFMRAIVVAIDELMPLNDTKINLYSCGGYKTNQFTAEFINRSERFLKQKGMKPRYFIVPKRNMVERFDEYDVNMVLFLSAKSENLEALDPLVSKAESKDINVAIYKI